MVFSFVIIETVLLITEFKHRRRMKYMKYIYAQLRKHNR